MTIKIKEEKVSINNKEMKHLNQDLKRLKEEGLDIQRIAKGEIKIKTLINIYRIE